MKARLISLGLCENYDLDNQTKHFNIFQIKNYFKNTLFHFEINSEKTKDYFCKSQYQGEGYHEQVFKILPKGGYFNPLDVQTKFYDNHSSIIENSIIERQPVFFVLLFPYPMFKFFNSYRKYGSSDFSSNPKPFSQKSFNQENLRKDNFSDYNLKIHLGSVIKIDNLLRNHDYYNNFFDNNNFPLFIDNHDELITLLNDLDSFYFNTLGFNLKLENISRIIIPFFELKPKEVLGLKNSKSDDLYL
jgi:hypothetical protein